MKEGKLDNDVLEASVLSKIKSFSPDILLGPGVGEDCGAIKFGDEACVVTTDPITGVTSGSGRLAVHVSCNDLASSGAEPVGITVTILAPPDATLKEIEIIMEEIASEAAEIGVAIIGGHTEITSAVTRMVLSITALGRTKADKLITTGGAKPGDWLYLSKSAAIEGTIIIASEKSVEIKEWWSSEDNLELEGLKASLSVLPEGRIGAGAGVTAMHDVTEGGVLGAIWELCEASGVGCTVWQSEIPIANVTRLLSLKYDFDPLRMIGSGAMLMTTSPEQAPLLEKNSAEKGILLRRIGVMEDHLTPRRLIGKDMEIQFLEKPEVDPLYRVLGY